MKNFKMLAVSAAMMASLIASGPAHAYAASEGSLWNVYGKLQSQLSQGVNQIMNRIQQAEDAIVKAIQDSQNAATSEGEKQTGAQKELTQAQLNFDATSKAKKVAAEAQDIAGGDEYVNGSCETLETANQAGAAAKGAGQEARAHTAALAARNLYTPSVGAEQKKLLATHDTNYCSAADEKRNRCKATTKILMQDAEISAGTLLSPANGSTYTKDESKAAEEFVKIATNPMPAEMLPNAFEKTAEGKTYILASRFAQAQSSVAQFSLSSIMKRHDVSTESASMDGLSVVGWMKKFVTDRFGNASWQEKINNAQSPVVLLREIALIQAGKNWMDYQAYEQAERMEAVMATTLAITARAYNEPRLAQLQAAVTNPKK
jgi:hypothetical protein